MAQYFHVGLIVPIQHAVLEDLFSQHHDQLFVIKSNIKRCGSTRLLLLAVVRMGSIFGLNIKELD